MINKFQQTICTKEHPTEAEVSKIKEEETHNPLLADCLSKYIHDKHTQEECSGFIDGFKAAQEQDRVLISELKSSLEYVIKCHDRHYMRCELNDSLICAKEIITKAEKHIQNL